MSSFFKALQNQAISALILTFAIVGEGYLIVHRLDQNEEADQQQYAKIEQIAENVDQLQLSVGKMKERQKHTEQTTNLLLEEFLKNRGEMH